MKKIIYIALISLTALVSCSKETLNPVPSNAVSDEQIFSSVESAQTALNSGMAYVGHYMSLTLGTVMAEVMGEDAAMSSGAYGFPTYNWNLYSYTYSQVPASEPWWFGYANYIWPADYHGIDAANSIITYVGAMEDEAGKDNLLGQAYALRGFMFLRLIRLFAPAYTLDANAPGVILRTEPADAASENLGRSSVKEVYAQVISDFNQAMSLISNTSTDYFTTRSVALFMARAYQDMADWGNAAKYAEIAAGNVFDGSNLMSKEEWRSGFKDHNAEWLMFFNFVPATSNYYASLPSFYYLADGYDDAAEDGKVDFEKWDQGWNVLDGYSTVRWTKRFRESFEDDDCRKMFPFYFYEADGYITNKFSHRTVIGDAEFPLARIAEAYLIKAEAEANSGNSSVAKSVLNALQVARGATPTDGSLDKIYYERRKELYGEGFRLHDLRRLHQPLDRTKDPEHWAEVKSLPADSPRFMLPIPEYEMLYNHALTAADQNEYWRK